MREAEKEKEREREREREREEREIILCDTVSYRGSPRIEGTATYFDLGAVPGY